jgi:hypothetical protein
MALRQAQLTADLRLVRGPVSPPAVAVAVAPTGPMAAGEGIRSMISFLDAESQLVFHAVVPHGSILKCISELLMRCAPHVPVTVDEGGLSFVACDPASGRLIHIVLEAADLLEFRFLRAHPLRCTLDSSSLHAVFHQLKRKDVVVLYATSTGQFGSLVDYSGRQHHTKHSTICVHHPAQAIEYVIPSGYRTEGVPVPSNILQRILREYKNLSKRIILTGNQSYIHIATDARVSLHRSDNLFGVPDPHEDDVSVELSISTLGRILKVTQFSAHVRIVCENGQPVRLKTQLGSHGSRVDVFIQPEAPPPPC